MLGPRAESKQQVRGRGGGPASSEKSRRKMPGGKKKKGVCGQKRANGQAKKC